MSVDFDDAPESGGTGELDALRQQVVRLAKEAAVNAAMADAGVKSTAAVKGLLSEFLEGANVTDGAVEGLGAKLKELAAASDTAFLFRNGASRFLGMTPGEGSDVPEGAGGSLSFEAELQTARESGNLLEAIRVKQEAAKEGVILI